MKMERNHIHAGQEITCSVSVTNVGNYDSDEVVQLYLEDKETSVRAPRYQLKGFQRIFLKQGETKNVSFTLRPRDMELVLDDGNSIIEPGEFVVYIGGGQPDSTTLCKTFSVC